MGNKLQYRSSFSPDSPLSKLIEKIIDCQISELKRGEHPEADPPAAAFECKVQSEFEPSFDDQIPITVSTAQYIADLPVEWNDIQSALNGYLGAISSLIPFLAVSSEQFLRQLQIEAGGIRIEKLEKDQKNHFEENILNRHLSSRFLSNASHDVRTPLTTLLGFTELLLEENYGSLNPEQLSVLSHILNATQNLQEVIDNLLDMLRVREGRRPLNIKQVIPSVLMKEIEVILQPLAQRREVALNVKLPQSSLIIEGDEGILRHILYLIIINALRSTPSKGIVKLSGYREKNLFVLELEDQASPLPMDTMNVLADPLVRLENSSLRGLEYWEFGLPLIQRYIEILNGSLELKSNEEVGNRIRVSLPVHQVKSNLSQI